MNEENSYVKIWEQDIVIPTYPIGAPDKNPMFLEKRVYQGSSGKVYPHAVIDKIRLLTEQHVFLIEGKKIDISISAGLSSVLEENLEEMIKRADEMLYKAKTNGRN